MLAEILQDYQIILASQSPRRQRLLKELQIDFTIKNFNIPEHCPKDLKAEKIPCHIAALKSKPFEDILKEQEILITADTIVWHKEKALEKPSDKAAAAKMLQQLSGATHRVITGVCIKTKYKTEIFSETTQVMFKALSEQEIVYYINHCQPFDKAGSYGIQDWIGLVGIRRIEGNYHNVMGLPVCRLYEKLKKPQDFFINT